jgi:hypothetical protein
VVAKKAVILPAKYPFMVSLQVNSDNIPVACAPVAQNPPLRSGGEPVTITHFFDG